MTDGESRRHFASVEFYLLAPVYVSIQLAGLYWPPSSDISG